MNAANHPGSLLPVNIITGFLGSGKTTLLRYLLEDPDFENTAVLINEFGEVGLDHLIAREVSEDVLLLDSGCLCCSAGEDLGSTLLELLDLRRSGEAEFDRVVIETSGLADPGPIVRLLMTDPGLGRHFRMGQVVAAVDGINGAETIGAYPEAQQQIGMSDAVLITKVDLIPEERLAALQGVVRTMNPMVELIDRSGLKTFFSGTVPSDRRPTVTDAHDHHHHDHAHTADVISFVVTIAEDVNLKRFIRWLELLLTARGKSILRVKGLLAVAGEERPRVVQAVQTIVFPLDSLGCWPDADRRTRLVFIGKDITAAAIERSLRKHAILGEGVQRMETA